MIHQSVWWLLHFSLRPFFLEKTGFDLLVLCFESFSLDTSSKATSWKTAICLLRLMTYSIVSLLAAISRPEYRLSYVLIFISHSVSNQFLFLNTFSFSSEFFTYQLIFHLVSEFLSVFRMLWMLVTLNKLKPVTCHGKHTPPIATNKTFFPKLLPSV